MALDNYSNFKSAIINLIGRNDVANKLDDAIAYTESKMYANPVETLRIRDMETRSTASLETTSRFLALPTLFMSMRRLKLSFSDDEWDLQQRAPELINVYDSTATGRPCFFTITSQLEFDITPDEAYTAEMQFYSRIAALTSAAPTNVILTNFPEIYIHGVMFYIHKNYTREQDEAQVHEVSFIESIQGANAQDREGRYGPAPVMRTERAIP
jgi:hypothetical protein